MQLQILGRLPAVRHLLSHFQQVLQIITINNAGNDFGTLIIGSGNDVNVLDIDTIILGASTISGTFQLQASGAITVLVMSRLRVPATFAGAANDITLDSAGNDYNSILIINANNVVIVDTDDVDFGASDIDGIGR